eukprot:CAMPEP_0171673482 /NCGR_PEP_ID=MMETSP0990-20121206/52616_1 /TAXON_ID=483369 /ORGANISM="non described non described, Strain CCMP2098" /LENGTH=45 /DNA_ID= /DNA_START= /DNA_END= /DNA_ORIENTATION=
MKQRNLQRLLNAGNFGPSGGDSDRRSRFSCASRVGSDRERVGVSG